MSIICGNYVRETSVKRINKIVQEITRNVTNVVSFYAIIAIEHGFSCINIRQVSWEVLKTEAEGRGFQHLPRDLANVNALKNHVWSLYYRNLSVEPHSGTCSYSANIFWSKSLKMWMRLAGSLFQRKKSRGKNEYL